MNLPDLFHYNSYKTYLSELVDKNSITRGFHSKLAKAAHCQASYLTQALSTKVELTPEHGLNIVNFLGFSAIEIDYFIALIHLSRAANDNLKSYYQNQIDKLRKKQNRISSNLQTSVENKTVEGFHQYYSNSIYMTVHMCLLLPGINTAQKISERLGVPTDQIKLVLNDLLQADVASVSNDIWQTQQTTIHLPAHHFMNKVSHKNWRLKAIDDIDNSVDAADDSIHYSSVMCMSRNDFKEMQKWLIKFTKESRALAMKSDNESLYSLQFDLFEI